MANWTRTTVTLVADNDALLSLLNRGFASRGFTLKTLSDLGNDGVPKLKLSDFVPEPDRGPKKDSYPVEEWRPIAAWRYANWGTKWDAEIETLALVASGEKVSAVEATLETANGFVEPMLQKIKDTYGEPFRSILCFVREDMQNYYGYFDIATDVDGSYIDCADAHQDLMDEDAEDIYTYLEKTIGVVNRTYDEYHKKVLAMVA